MSSRNGGIGGTDEHDNRRPIGRNSHAQQESARMEDGAKGERNRATKPACTCKEAEALGLRAIAVLGMNGQNI